MTAIEIVREDNQTSSETRYRAITHAGNVQSVGKTAGEALDALTAQLTAEEGGTLVIVQQMNPDRFFTTAQIHRLQELTERLQTASLTVEEQAEYHTLIATELMASAHRTAALADVLGR